MGDRKCTVSQGGLFHVHKTKYSPETADFLRELIRESKMSIFQRKEVQNSIKNGQPLPLPPKKTALSNKKKITPLDELRVVKYMIPRRRKFSTIQSSGAFERDRFVPTYEKANYEEEKKKLQEIMAFGRTLKSGKSYKKQLNDDEESVYEESGATTQESFFREMQEEIDEKRKFLERMQRLGQGKKYKDKIENEIAETYNLIGKMKKKFKELNTKNDECDKKSFKDVSSLLFISS